MNAIIHRTYGGPELLSYEKIQMPEVGPKDLLIRVMATSVNRTDCAMMRAKPFIMRFLTGLSKPRNPILGTEFSGVVEAVGDEVDKYNIGDRVFGFDDIGVSSHAEYLSINQNAPIAIIPANTSYYVAACSIEGCHYARNFLNKVNIPEGSKVLVNGASGAIGSAMVQLLSRMNVITDAVIGTPNLELAAKLGANRIYDYLKEDFTKSEVMYDFVFDAVGKSSLGKSKSVLTKRGVYISSELGYMAQNPFFALTTPFLGGRQVKFPYPADKPGSALMIADLLEAGEYSPVIDRTYTLEDIPEAFKYVETGNKVGNVVISVESNP